MRTVPTWARTSVAGASWETRFNARSTTGDTVQTESALQSRMLHRSPPSHGCEPTRSWNGTALFFSSTALSRCLRCRSFLAPTQETLPQEGRSEEHTSELQSPCNLV